MNALRIPFNYSHFLYEEKQLFPFKINQEGFKQLDRVVKICADHAIYTIFDLHAVPGGQNTELALRLARPSCRILGFYGSSKLGSRALEGDCTPLQRPALGRGL